MAFEGLRPGGTAGCTHLENLCYWNCLFRHMVRCTGCLRRLEVALVTVQAALLTTRAVTPLSLTCRPCWGALGTWAGAPVLACHRSSHLCMQAGTPVMVLPSGETGTVRSVEVDGAPVELATAGDSADLTLSGGLLAAAVCLLPERERESMLRSRGGTGGGGGVGGGGGEPCWSLPLLPLSAVSLAGLNTERLLCVQVLTLQC